MKKSELSAEIMLAIREEVSKERERSDKTYARKLFETGVIAIVTLFTGAIITQWVAKLFIK